MNIGEKLYKIIYKSYKDFINSQTLAGESIAAIQNYLPNLSKYTAIHYLINHENYLSNHAHIKKAMTLL